MSAEGMSTGMKVAVALAAAGAAAYAASVYFGASAPAKKKTTVTLELEKVHIEWLKKMAETYKLPDLVRPGTC